MRKIIILSALLFLAAPLCFSQQAQEVKSEPNLWDFGAVKEGEIVRHEFTLKNESTKALNIKELHSSCGCTVSEVKKKKLLPQEATTIQVKFDSKGYSGPTQQFVYVHTDNLDNPVIKFIIKADVIKKD